MAKPLSLFEKYKKLAADEGKPFKSEEEAIESYRRFEDLAEVFLDMALEDIRKGRKWPTRNG